MSLSRYLLTMIAATLLCWLAWVLVLININPFGAGLTSFFIFYASLFLALVGSFTLIGFVVRVWLLKQDEPYFRQVKKTFRHGLLLAALLIFALLLQSQRLLNWWRIILLILVFALLELFFLTNSPKFPLKKP